MKTISIQPCLANSDWIIGTMWIDEDYHYSFAVALEDQPHELGLNGGRIFMANLIRNFDDTPDYLKELAPDPIPEGEIRTAAPPKGGVVAVYGGYWRMYPTCKTEVALLNALIRYMENYPTSPFWTSQIGVLHQEAYQEED